MPLRSKLAFFTLLISMALASGTLPGAESGIDRAFVLLEQGLGLLGLKSGEVAAGFLEQAASGNFPGRNLGEFVSGCTELALDLSRIDSTRDLLALGLKVSGLKADSRPVLSEEETGPDLREAAAILDSVLPGAGESLVDLVLAGESVHSAYRSLSTVESEELSRLVRGFRPQDDQWPDYPVERMLALAGKVDLPSLWTATFAAERAASILRGLAAGRKIESGEREKSVGPLLSLATPWGMVIVGGEGPDTYRGEPPFLLIELGGDDIYELSPQGWNRVSMVIDFKGQDRYSARGDYALAGVLGGLSWLEDLEGDDIYEGSSSSSSFSLGAAALGAGVLIDRQGNDKYRGASFSQGASFFGLGILVDFAGDDSYEVSYCGQGGSIGPGSGILVDLEGNDRYTAGGLYPDYREKGATKSHAQGASGGLRPYLRGGTALLYDRSGNDSYRIDYFGQGAGYWGGTGILVEGGGDDSYFSGRYGQGCGLHMAAGALIDLGGDDSYTIGGVGQGAGEDRAYGILIEGGGADTYSAGWMARGAGGTGGVGLLLEISGDDRYSEARKAADGFGNRWQELGSLGFLIDCEGRDLYGQDNKQGFIRRQGTWGAKIDLPLCSSGN